MSPEHQDPQSTLLNEILPVSQGPDRMLRAVRRRKVTRHIPSAATLLIFIATAAWLTFQRQPVRGPLDDPPIASQGYESPELVRINYINDEELAARLRDQPYAITGKGNNRTVLLINGTFSSPGSL